MIFVYEIMFAYNKKQNKSIIYVSANAKNLLREVIMNPKNIKITCKTNGVTGYKRIIILLAAISIIMLCASSNVSANVGSIQSYKDIPGITQEEIDAIEALKQEQNSFSYGLYYSTEAFVLPDGTFAGYAAKFCGLMSDLFGIEIEQKFCDQESLISGLSNMEIDFTGELTPMLIKFARFYITQPIAQRTLRIFGFADCIDEIKEESDINGLKLGFLEGSLSIDLIAEYYNKPQYERVLVSNTAAAVEALESGAIDLFIVNGVLEPMFEEYDFIKSKEFFPLAFIPVSLGTVNPALESFISVMNKYIDAGGIDRLYEFYEEGEKEYARYKFYKSLTEEERTWLKSRQNTPVKVVLGGNYYPVLFYNKADKEFQGISIDLMNEIGELTGLTFEVKNEKDITMQSLMELLQTGEVSMTPHLLYTPERKEAFIMSDISFAAARYALISKLDYPNLAIHQLDRLNIGMVRDSAFEDTYHKWFPEDSKINSYVTLEEAFNALDKGEIDLIMGSEYTLLTQTNYHEKSGYKMNILFEDSVASHFGFNKNEHTLSSVVNKALAIVKTDSIVRSWTSRNFDYSKKLAEDRALYLLVIVAGTFVFLLGAYYTVSRRRKYRQMDIVHQNLQMILDTMPVAVRILDPDSNKILYINRACLRLYNAPDDYDPGSVSVAAYMPDVQPDGVLSMERLAELDRQAEPSSAEMVLTKVSGENFSGRITACQIEYHGKMASLGVIEDLTAEKEYLGMLENTAQKEREANQLKSSFLSNMSHEIRTPMNAIIGLTEIAFHKELSKEVFETFKKINISAQNLLQIVNDILDLSKIEADKLELYSDDFELEEVLNSALLVVSPRLEGKRVELMLDVSLDLPRFLNGDRTRLWQVLKNYLDNAAKYTTEGRIILTASEDKARSTKETIFIAFSVTDTGIGMNEEQIQKAFQPYEQVFSEAQKRYAGTGLGMPISKKICEMMGGVLDIESEPERGTVVRFTIPFLRVENVQTEKDMLAADSLSGLLIMVVEDDALSLEIMESLLVSCGAEYIAAHSGEEALKIIQNWDKNAPLFDVILLDYMMSGINGIETAKQIRLGTSGSSRLLMVTAYESLLIKDEMKACGIDDVIEKPFIPSRFIKKIRTAAGLDCAEDTGTKQTQVSFENTRILVCEDNEINREVAAGILEQFGIVTVAAENGKVGIDLLNSGETFDLILMDLHMPVMDGFETTHAIRSDPLFDAIPIISLTADAMTEIVDKCFALGMNDYLSKPLQIDALSECLLKWLPKNKQATE